jgi:hypothetical protein
MKYIAQYKSSHQISPDDWDTVTPTLEVDENTTIGQIREWAIRTERISQSRLQHWKLDVKIIQVDILLP